MSLSELRRIIEKFGVMVDHWPPERLEDALDLLQTSPEAQDMFAAATAEEDELFGLLNRTAAPTKGRA
jgi:hypothetical protein